VTHYYTIQQLGTYNNLYTLYDWVLVISPMRIAGRTGLFAASLL